MCVCERERGGECVREREGVCACMCACVCFLAYDSHEQAVKVMHVSKIENNVSRLRKINEFPKSKKNKFGNVTLLGCTTFTHTKLHLHICAHGC